LKTDPKAANGDATTEAQLLETLLQRPAAARESVPERIDGLLIGRLEKIGEDGRPRVAIDRLGLRDLAAVSLASLSAEHVGRAVALGFEAADPRRPIILGMICELEETEEETDAQQAAPFTVSHENGRVVIQAEDELELRCGKAVILLQSDGRIHIRGGYITSHASAGQRIRGGSVQIN